MNSIEFSNEFDLLYNNVMSNQAAPIDECEKSMLLSKAQDEVVFNYFNPKGNKYQEGFDDSAKRQYNFGTIVKTLRYNKDGINELNFTEVTAVQSIFSMGDDDKNVHRYKMTLPPNFLFFINEECLLERYIHGTNLTRNATVTPINFGELNKARGDVYKFPVSTECWRVYNNIEGEPPVIEILAPYASKIVTYKARFVRKPKPIVLVNLTQYGVSIDGVDGNELPFDVSDAEVCELPKAMHREIVQRAVEIAKAAYRTGETEVLTQLGQRSE